MQPDLLSRLCTCVAGILSVLQLVKNSVMRRVMKRDIRENIGMCNGKWEMGNEELGIIIPLLFQKGWPKAGVVI